MGGMAARALDSRCLRQPRYARVGLQSSKSEMLPPFILFVPVHVPLQYFINLMATTPLQYGSSSSLVRFQPRAKAMRGQTNPPRLPRIKPHQTSAPNPSRSSFHSKKASSFPFTPSFGKIAAFLATNSSSISFNLAICTLRRRSCS